MQRDGSPEQNRGLLFPLVCLTGAQGLFWFGSGVLIAVANPWSDPLAVALLHRAAIALGLLAGALGLLQLRVWGWWLVGVLQTVMSLKIPAGAGALFEIPDWNVESVALFGGQVLFTLGYLLLATTTLVLLFDLSIASRFFLLPRRALRFTLLLGVSIATTWWFGLPP